MNKPEHILVATDGSDRANTAVELAASLPWPTETRLEILEVAEHLFAGVETPGPRLVELERLQQEEIAKDLAKGAARLRTTGREVPTAIRRGRAASEIVREAGRMSADLIVLGSRGRGPIATMVLGSVAAEVVDQATCPVLIARRPTAQRLVVADDGSASAALAVKLACTWSIFRGMSARAVSVAPAQAITGFGPIRHEDADAVYAEAVDALRQMHDAIARDCAKELSDAGVPTTPDRRFGDPAQEIINAALESSADLIVMGTRGQTGLQRLVLGSVARKVLTHAPMSVLIVRG